MTSFEPPTFSFTGLQFNADIFENPLTETNIIPDPLPITELDTNNIQPQNVNTSVTLYTTHQADIQLGGYLTTSLNLQVINTITNYCSFFTISGFGRRLKTLLDTVGTIKQEYYSDSANAVTKSAEIIVTKNPITATIDNTGFVSILAESLTTPNILTSMDNTVNQLLYTSNTNTIRIGNASGTGCQVNCPLLVDTINSILTTMTLSAQTISNSAPIVNLADTGATSVINCNAQLIPKYAYNVTTGVLDTGAIGYIQQNTNPATTTGTSTNVETTIKTIASLPVGVWLLTGGIQYNAINQWFGTSISSTNNVHDFSAGQSCSGALTNPNAQSCSRIVVVASGTQTWYLVRASSATTGLTNINFQAVRLA